ncbi:MAG: methylglutaconyl-CoA hydratase [Salibacteraceae bacterium]|jgi:methylglutaconyl-CoA hydratase
MNKNTEQEGHVEFHLENGIATIEFYHPMSNSLPGYLLNELASTIASTKENELVNVVILKSRGERAFCGGASFEELTSITDFETGKTFFSGFAKVINAIRTCGKIVIGRVQGKAVGGGVGLASAVDYCFATKFAAVRLSELAIGIGPFVVGPAVARKVGNNNMNMMAITPEKWQSTDWALQNGLYHEVHDTLEAMDEAILLFAKKLSGYNPEALANLKSIFWEGTEHWDKLLPERAEVSGKLVLSDFTKNAIAQFKAK